MTPERTASQVEDASSSDWRALGVTLAGRTHREAGRPNEDALTIASLPDGSLLLALADGAGSASRAATGSQLAVTLAAQHAEVMVGDGIAPEHLLPRVVAELRRYLATEARSQRTRPREFASTLLLALADRERVTALQLGDGAIVVDDGSGWIRLTEPQRGRHAAETSFLTSPRAHRNVTTVSREVAEVRSLAMLTDGLEPLAFDFAHDLPFAPFFDPLAGFVREGGSEEALEEFLRSERVQSRTYDDLSLILAIPAP